MAQVLAAAWVGVMVGWMGFGWVLNEAPSEQVASVTAGTTVVAQAGNPDVRG
jgi:hypothetical protein